LKNTILFSEIAIVFRKKRSQFGISQSFFEKHDPVFRNCDRVPEKTIAIWQIRILGLQLVAFINSGGKQ
jgi:hypothetical protein